VNQPSPLPLVNESSCGSGSSSVPVFNCIVILRSDPNTGKIQGRSANLPDITAEDTTERQVLMKITRRFKTIVQEHTGSNTPVPWREPPERAAAGEVERFIPVHL
jgi:hypothetical protein